MKQAKSMTFIGASLIALSIIFVLVTDFAPLPFVISVILFIVGAIFLKIGKERARKFCRKCYASLDGCAYRWEVYRTSYRSNNSYADVRITSECPKCGATFTFNKEFCTYDSSTNTYYEIRDLIENYTYDLFGH